MGAIIIDENDMKNTKYDSIHEVYPKNYCSINQSCMNLPPAIADDLQNQGYFFYDVKKTHSLVKILEADEYCQTLQVTDHSSVIIRKLDGLFKQWLIDEEQKRITKSEINQIEQNEWKTSKSSPLVLAYGSYQLGVQDKNSDLDLLCIGPEFITRENWISNFYTILKSNNEIKDVEALPKASIPIIQLKINEIEIELAFVQLKIKNIPVSLDLGKNSSLVGLDCVSNRTLNAWYTTDKILHMVPNVKLYRFTLRVIRLWAKKNGLYSSKLGYLSGISWAILVAKTCLLYPRMDAAGLIHKFFFMYTNWEWPKRMYLVDPDKPKGKCNLVLRTRYKQDMMPIMTPTYPQENSACNVIFTSRYNLKTAFERAYLIVNDIMEGTRKNCNIGWQRLFEANDFFNKYEHFIVVYARSLKGANHAKWQKHIEFKMVNFLRALERHLVPCISTINYRPKNLENGTDCSIWFIGILLLPFKENYEYGVLNEATVNNMKKFECLSMNQAKKYKFGSVELEVKYMLHTECTSILQDLEIRNKC